SFTSTSWTNPPWPATAGLIMFSIRSCTLVISSSLMGLLRGTITLPAYSTTAGLPEVVEERLRGPEIGGVEALGEPAIDRCQEVARRPGPTSLVPPSGEAGGAAQLHGQRSLAARPLQRLLEVLLGRGGGARGSRLHDELALDAQELRDAPVLLVALGSGERLVDGREPLGDLPAAGQALGEGAEQGRVVRDEAGLPELLEGIAEKGESGAALAALDEQDAIQA